MTTTDDTPRTDSEWRALLASIRHDHEVTRAHLVAKTRKLDAVQIENTDLRRMARKAIADRDSAVESLALSALREVEAVDALTDILNKLKGE